MSDETNTPTEPDDETTAEPGYDGPSVELPSFEGFRVYDTTAKLTATPIPIGRALHHGDTIVLVVEAKLNDVGHPKKDGRLTRHHKLVAASVLEVADVVYADALLEHLRRQSLRTIDEAEGRQSFGIETTADGIVLTPGDKAAGDPPPPIPVDDEVIVIFDGYVPELEADRAFWPDDFPSDMSERPGVGDHVYLGDGADPVLVVELIDPTRGDTIAELDRTGEAAAAIAADADATAELEAARGASDDRPYDDRLVAELAGECRRRGLPVGGNKGDLVDRLIADDQASEEDDGA